MILGLEALATVDLLITQGADCRFAFRWTEGSTPVDLTGWEGRMQIRDSFGGEVWLDLDSTTGDIDLGADGAVVISIDHTATEPDAWNGRPRILGGELLSSGVYDLELIKPDGEVVRFVRGAVSVSPDVTRGAP